MTWGEFKRHVDRQLAEGTGNEEEVRSIDWSGLEDPVVMFRTLRRSRETQNVVDIP